MQHISLFFDKYLDPAKEVKQEKDLICKIIYECTGILLEESFVELRNNSIVLKLTPGQRSFFLEKKEDLISDLSKKLNKKLTRIA